MWPWSARTGAVGIEMLKTLEKRNFPVGKLTLLASARSVGKKLKFRGAGHRGFRNSRKIRLQELTSLCSAPAEAFPRNLRPLRPRLAAWVVDNSSAFRQDPMFRSSWPEINAADVKSHKGIIANPNCTTAITLMALYPLHQAFGVKRVFASSYQAVSGTGAQAIEELKRQVEQIVSGKPVTKEVYPHQIAFNVFPQVDSFLPNGYTKEEMKMENEGRKIMHHPAFRASVTCVRVPVYRSHSIAVSAEFEKPVSVEAARDVLKKAPGLDLVDEPENKKYPMPLFTSEKDNCEVGRIRMDCALDNGLCFWVSGDQLLKGAAAQCRADRGRVAEIVTAFGAGKSRCYWTVTASLHSVDW